MNLLLDIGNTRTHAALAGSRIRENDSFPTAAWVTGRMGDSLKKFIGRNQVSHAMVCSVVPAATRAARAWLKAARIKFTVFNHRNCGLGIDYPKPTTIGPDRLANALAAKAELGAPVVVVDFGTALTFDIVNEKGRTMGLGGFHAAYHYVRYFIDRNH